MRRAATLALVLVVAACASPQPATQSSADPGRELAGKVTVDGMRAHLDKLSDIATGNNGSRAAGTPGYDASVDYVAGVLRDKGFDVETPEFDKVVQTDMGDPTLTVAGRRFPVTQASMLVTTAADGLKAITLRPQKPAGCTAADYGTVNVRGAIAIVDDTGCSVVEKHDAAMAKGAVGLLVVSDGGAAGLFPAGYYQGLKSPVAIVGNDVDARLRRTTAPVQLVARRQGQVGQGAKRFGADEDRGHAQRHRRRCAPGFGAAQPRHERRRFGCRRGARGRRPTGWLAHRGQCGPVRLLGI